jgi:glycosyltransferase involved in cell wall biosynthesis
MVTHLRPVISVIIPCFNQGRFLANAINSVYNLGYERLEIIVVDDGSTDNTRKVAQSFPHVTYFFQPNAGLPATRNTGFERSHGDYISFLDADDWYLPQALIKNLEILVNSPHAAFISGCHQVQRKDGSLMTHCFHHTNNFYQHLLITNYIGNPSTVIYRRSTLEKFRFNTSLAIKGCEDYDHYLSIARELPILHNPIPISVYRIHDNNMSNDYAMMLNSALNVLLRQKPFLKNAEEKRAWEAGWDRWVRFYEYFPVWSNNKRQLTKAHLGLIQKYHIHLPWIIWKKMRLFLGKRKTNRDTALAEGSPAEAHNV